MDTVEGLILQEGLGDLAVRIGVVGDELLGAGILFLDDEGDGFVDPARGGIAVILGA
jgi:hypothetical protein